MSWTMEQIDYPILSNQIPKRTKRPLEPERVLWSMVLREAIQCYQGRAICEGKEPRKETKAREAARAKRWFLSPDTEPYSFRWVADLLGLDPDVFISILRRGELPVITLHRKEYGKGVRKAQRAMARDVTRLDATGRDVTRPDVT